MGTRWWASKQRILMSNSLAVVLTLATLGFCVSVGKGWPEPLTLSLFLIPILVCAYLGGLWPGLFASFLSCLLSDYFLIEPRYSFRIGSPLTAPYLAGLAGTGLLATVLIQFLHRRRADDTRGSDSSLRVAEWKIWVSSLAALALLVTVTIASFREVGALGERDAWVNHTHQVISSVRRVQSLVTETISGQRGYLISGDDDYLQPYTAALKDLDAELSILGLLISDNPDQVNREQKLEEYISERLAVLQGALELRRTQGLAAAQAAIAGSEGRRLEQTIAAAAAEMERQEWLLLKGRQDRAQRTASYCRTVIVLGSLLAFGIVVTALSLVAQDFAGSRRASRELKESRDQLERRVVERTAQLEEAQRLAHVGGWQLNPETGEISWTKEVYRVFGIDPGLPTPAYEQLRGILTPESFARMNAAIDTTRRTGVPYNIDLQLTRPDGSTRWIAARGEGVLDDSGKVTALRGTAQDITERKQAEEALRESEAQFRTLANAIPQLCWMAKADGWIVWYNERWYRYTGMTPQQMEGWGWQSVHDSEALPKVLERWKASIATGEPFDMVFPLRGSDGVLRPFLTRVMPVRDTEGKIVRWFGTNTDISEQQRVEEELRKGEERLSLVLEAARIGTWDWDICSDRLELSPRSLEIFALPPDTHMSYARFLQAIHPDDRQRIDLAVQTARDKRKHFDVEMRTVWPNGTVHWATSRGRTYYNEAGRPTRMSGAAQDITERKHTEEKLKERAALIDLAHDAIILRDLNGRILLWSRGAGDTYGFSAEEALGKIAHELLKTLFPIPPNEIHSYIAQTREWEGELGHTRSDCRQITVASRWSLLRDKQGNPIGVMEINRDITERKQAEEALRKIEWMLTEKETRDSEQTGTPQYTTSLPAYGELTELNSCRLILDSVGNPVLQEITSDFLDLLGTSAAIFEKNGDYAFGALSSIWCRTLDSASRGLCHTSDNSEARRSGQWICRESCWNRSAGLTMQTGQPTDMECDGGLRIHSVPIHAGAELIGSMSFGYGDPPREESKLLELAAKYGVPIEELRRQAESYESRPAFIIEMAKKRLRTAANRIGEIVLRKRMEIELEQKAKDLAKSNDELGQFAYVASHDLQEPLRKIGAFGDRLAEHCEAALDEQGRDYLQRMQNAAQRMSLLIESLLALSRVTSKARALEVVDLNSVVSDVLSDLEVRIQQTGGRVEVDALPTVMADGSQMRQLFQNLIGNALKFRKQDVPPLVRVQTKENGKGTWEIHVVDNGIGFDEQYVARIFRPFQRLHARSAFEGSGIGLAICNKIVGRHLGQITARSQPGVGSDFVVVLPRTPIAKEAKA